MMLGLLAVIVVLSMGGTCQAAIDELYPDGTCVCTTATNLNGRDKPSLSGAIIGSIPNGRCGHLRGQMETHDGYDWYSIEYNGRFMWVAGKYLILSTACCPAPTSCSGTTSAPSSGSTDTSTCPRIISRSEWSARAPKSVSYLSGQMDYAFIHHTASPNCFDVASCSAKMRGIQNYHMDSKGWDDIGYSFLIGGDGNVYEGRGWDRVGAHTQGYNSVGLAFSLVGNFMSQSPPAAQLEAAQRAIACGVSKGKLKPNYTLRGHKDMGSTSCPGDALYAIIVGWSHY